eukprot:1140927-Pelagomonas_calceolata.AAC.8
MDIHPTKVHSYYLGLSAQVTDLEGSGSPGFEPGCAHTNWVSLQVWSGPGSPCFTQGALTLPGSLSPSYRPGEILAAQFLAN